MSQRPFKVGQEPRTKGEQESFSRAVMQMHTCYCFSDVVIHLHLDPPQQDDDMFVAHADMSKLEVAQVGDVVQVVGVHAGDNQDGLTAFDVIISIDGVEISNVKQVISKCGVVRYRRRPFGKINSTLVQDRGWVHLERFITMVKMAMMELSVVDDRIFTNSEVTRRVLGEGAHRLSHAAKEGNATLIATLAQFKEELKLKRFSGASTDKCVNDAGFAAADDAAVVGNLMDEIVASLGRDWVNERAKQKASHMRFKADVPLLVLTPRSWRNALISWSSLFAIVAVAAALLAGGSVAYLTALAVEDLTAQALALVTCTSTLLLLHLLCLLQSVQIDLGVSFGRVAWRSLPVCSLTGMAALCLFFLMSHNSQWNQNFLHIWVPFVVFIPIGVLMKTIDIFTFYAHSAVKSSFKAKGRSLPGTKAKLCFSFTRSAPFFVLVSGSIWLNLACLRWRQNMLSMSPFVGAAIVLSMSVCKQIAMCLLASKALPAMKANFATTDSAIFAICCLLTFAQRMLITGLSSTSAILATSVITSVLELGSSAFVLHRSDLRVQAMKQKLKRGGRKEQPAGSNGQAVAVSAESKDSYKPKLQLWIAERQMSSEIILVINELFLEFFVSAISVIWGMTFRSSGVLWLLSSQELSWDVLPMFVAAAYGPEAMDALLVVVYLTRLGVDWIALCKTILVDRRILIAKLTCVFGVLSSVLQASITDK